MAGCVDECKHKWDILLKQYRVMRDPHKAVFYKLYNTIVIQECGILDRCQTENRLQLKNFQCLC